MTEEKRRIAVLVGCDREGRVFAAETIPATAYSIDWVNRAIECGGFVAVVRGPVTIGGTLARPNEVQVDDLVPLGDAWLVEAVRCARFPDGRGMFLADDEGRPSLWRDESGAWFVGDFSIAREALINRGDLRRICEELAIPTGEA